MLSAPFAPHLLGSLRQQHGADALDVARHHRRGDVALEAVDAVIATSVEVVATRISSMTVAAITDTCPVRADRFMNPLVLQRPNRSNSTDAVGVLSTSPPAKLTPGLLKTSDTPCAYPPEP
ncbi:hypothetical protein [Thiocapsa bogorovii]|nr:hypothetical protein [Thiocapsa bogorovii]UHD17603.1 hypothetical protein LT988_06015 [Thiocapsa bogorovii]